jgi:hypothetical protein
MDGTQKKQRQEEKVRQTAEGTGDEEDEEEDSEARRSRQEASSLRRRLRSCRKSVWDSGETLRRRDSEEKEVSWEGIGISDRWEAEEGAEEMDSMSGSWAYDEKDNTLNGLPLCEEVPEEECLRPFFLGLEVFLPLGREWGWGEGGPSECTEDRREEEEISSTLMSSSPLVTLLSSPERSVESSSLKEEAVPTERRLSSLRCPEES